MRLLWIGYTLMLGYLLFFDKLRFYLHPRWTFLMLFFGIMMILFSLVKTSYSFKESILFSIPLILFVFYPATVLDQGTILDTWGDSEYDYETIEEYLALFQGNTSIILENNSFIVHNDNFAATMDLLYTEPARFLDFQIQLNASIHTIDYLPLPVAGRLLIWHCLADAHLKGIMIKTSENLTPGNWYQLEGTLGVYEGKPMLRVEQFKSIEEPEDQYLFG